MSDVVSDTYDRNYRNYEDADSSVREHYKNLRKLQTLNYVQRMHQKYLKFDTKMDLWEVLERLEDLIDVSDPDLIEMANVHHAFQTAEMMRRDGQPEWMQLVGLIHDCGKVLTLIRECPEDGVGKSSSDQWGLVGDTFIVGCRIPDGDNVVYSEYNSLNPDMKEGSITSTNLGIYQKECGLDQVWCSWGHDEYLYQVLKHHLIEENELPEIALYVIRYHSLYPWHSKGCYDYLLSSEDRENLKYVQEFNRYDLYSKENVKVDYDSLREYYTTLMEKYGLNGKILW